MSKLPVQIASQRLIDSCKNRYIEGVYKGKYIVVENINITGGRYTVGSQGLLLVDKSKILFKEK